MISRQQKHIVEQERLIRHLKSRLSSPPSVDPFLLETQAIACLPKMSSLDSNTSTIDHKRLPVIDEIESDSDSVIQLDSSFDSLRSKDNSLVSNNSLTIKSRRTQCSPHILCSRQLQRSILDVVDLRRRLEKDYKDTSPFCDFIYRGFLLRH